MRVTTSLYSMFRWSAAFFAAARVFAVQAGEITFTSWGGSYAKAQLDTAVTPFSRVSGTNVKMEQYPGGLEELRRQVKSGKVTWDVLDMTLSDGLIACDEGLIEPVDPNSLMPSGKGDSIPSDFMPGALSKCLVGTNIWSTVFAYNNKAFIDKEPQTIVDVFDIVKYPGKRGLKKGAQGNLEFALMADGVPVDRVYAELGTPGGVARAFRKLDQIRPYVVWWTGGSEPVEMLEGGVVQMSSAYNGRIYNASLRGNKPLRFVWDGQLLSIDGLAIVKGARNRSDALEFLKYASSPQAMAALAPLTAYGPARYSAAARLDAVMMHLLPTAQWYAKRSLVVDARWWTIHGPALEQRFNVWLGK